MRETAGEAAFEAECEREAAADLGEGTRDDLGDDTAEDTGEDLGEDARRLALPVICDSVNTASLASGSMKLRAMGAAITPDAAADASARRGR